jgi:hypothetical protein
MSAAAYVFSKHLIKRHTVNILRVKSGGKEKIGFINVICPVSGHAKTRENSGFRNTLSWRRSS